MNRRRIALGLLVSVVCLYFVFRDVHWGEVVNHLSDVDIPIFLLSMLLMLGAYFLMTWRWHFLLAPLEQPTPPNPTQTTSSPNTQPPALSTQLGIFSLYAKMLT